MCQIHYKCIAIFRPVIKKILLAKISGFIVYEDVILGMALVQAIVQLWADSL